MARFVILLLVIVALGGCAGTFRERIYQPSALGAEPEWPDGRAPLRMQVTTDDGIALDGLWWPPRSGQRDVIVYFHGNAGNLYRDSARAVPLAADGRGLLMTSYRGYSGLAGTPTESGLRRDAAAYVDWARAQVPAGGRLFLFGHSLGGAVALGEAARRPVDGVITLGAFARMSDMAPALVRFAMPDRYDNLSTIARVRAPVLLIHGTGDEIVPFRQAQRLAAAGAGHTRFIPLNGAGHHPPMDRLAPLIWQLIDNPGAD